MRAKLTSWLPLSFSARASFWRTALRLARKEVRATPRRAILAILAIAAGASAVTAVHVLSQEMRAKVRGDAREWIAADILIQFRDPPAEDELAKITAMDHTLVTGTFGMAGSSQVPDAVLAYVRVVDPARYPFYGSIGLNPAVRFASALQADTLVASRDLLDALRVKAGDTIRVGKAAFRAVAAITHEPDWEVGVSTFLPHVVLSYAGYERAQIARAGVEADYRLLVRLRGIGLAQARERLARWFPDCEQLDYRDPSPKAAAAFDAAAGFLWLAALLTLACGAMAVALIIYLQVEQRLDSAAIMKALGARYRQLLAIYMAQAAGLALAGGAVAALSGMALTKGLTLMANAYLPLQLQGHWTGVHSLYAVLVAMVAVLPSMLIPVVQLRTVMPLLVVRRHSHMAHTTPVFRIRRGPVALRVAARNLFRPGLHTGTMIAALAFGVMLVSATFLCQRRVSEQVAASVPASGANLFVIGASRLQVEEAGQWLAAQDAVQSRLQAFPLVWMRLRAVNGRPIDRNRTAGEWLVTCSDQVAQGEVALAPEADVMGARPGDLLALSARGRTMEARVARGRVSHMDNVISALTLPCAALDAVELFYHGAVRVRPAEEGRVRRQLAQRFPSLPTLSRDQFTRFVGNLADQTVSMMRMVCWQVLGIGVGLQLLLIASARRLRLRESAVLKALGAPPAQVAAAYSLEFGSIGLMAGVVGVSGGTLLAFALLTGLLHTPAIAFSWRVWVAGIAGTCALSAAGGWVFCMRQLRIRPLELLRGE
ncbi:MAG: hypothetical protein HY820_02365 [Acidobacteria bacterium]|nr:hypothetical protein [Acidobacteriota bacterium]